MSASLLDQAVMITLIGQVQSAMPPGGVETQVRTLITRPMWDAFCRAAGMPVPCLPTEWRPWGGTRRVFGSETIVVESNRMAAVSFPIPISEQ